MERKANNRTQSMKVGIVTFSDNINYGGSLQEYALYKLLSEDYDAKCVYYKDDKVTNFQVVRMGFISKTVNLIKGMLGTTGSPQSNYDAKITSVQKQAESKKLVAFIRFFFKGVTNSLALMTKDLFNIRNRKILISRYIDFWEKLTRTESYTSDDLFQGKCDSFDVYVAGGDQIWNPTITCFDTVYFLDFAPNETKKISFSSSFGNFDFQNDGRTKMIGDMLSSFMHISVREEQSVENLKDILNINAVQVLDPTLMYTRHQWLQMLDITDVPPKRPYVLVYALYDRTKLLKIAKKIAKILEFEVFVLDSPIFKGLFGNTTFCPSAGPKEFVELIAKANFLVTNSFHGTAFAVNFNVKFLSIKSHRSERIISFLKNVGLLGFLMDGNEITGNVLQKPYDFTASNAILQKERAKAKDFLNSAIEG